MDRFQNGITLNNKHLHLNSSKCFLFLPDLSQFGSCLNLLHLTESENFLSDYFISIADFDTN